MVEAMQDQIGEKERFTALMSAMTTEHFVLQSAISTTASEMAARASMYVFALSSSLVAMGFVTQSSEAFIPFVATVLPALFMLGVLTVLRMIDISAESIQAHIGIARIRAYYRSLGDDAQVYFAANRGRWPETATSEPALRMGPLIGYVTSAATVIACVNTVVGAAGVVLLARHVLGASITVALLIGIVCAAALLLLFYFYQRFRISELASAAQADDGLQQAAVSHAKIASVRLKL
jgi:hypothetical protein